jgi:hypothetical protein
MRQEKLRIGAIAQMGERVNGIHEVGGSIPPGSTTAYAKASAGEAFARRVSAEALAKADNLRVK